MEEFHVVSVLSDRHAGKTIKKSVLFACGLSVIIMFVYILHDRHMEYHDALSEQKLYENLLAHLSRVQLLQDSKRQNNGTLSNNVKSTNILNATNDYKSDVEINGPQFMHKITTSFDESEYDLIKTTTTSHLEEQIKLPQDVITQESKSFGESEHYVSVIFQNVERSDDSVETLQETVQNLGSDERNFLQTVEKDQYHWGTMLQKLLGKSIDTNLDEVPLHDKEVVSNDTQGYLNNTSEVQNQDSKFAKDELEESQNVKLVTDSQIIDTSSDTKESITSLTSSNIILKGSSTVEVRNDSISNKMNAIQERVTQEHITKNDSIVTDSFNKTNAQLYNTLLKKFDFDKLTDNSLLNNGQEQVQIDDGHEHASIHMDDNIASINEHSINQGNLKGNNLVIVNQDNVENEKDLANGYRDLAKHKLDLDKNDIQEDEKDPIIDRSDLDRYKWKLENQQKDDTIACALMRTQYSSFQVCLHNLADDPDVSGILLTTGTWGNTFIHDVQLATLQYADAGLIDVGAGIGVFTLAVASIHRHVVAIEPSLSHMQRIQKAVKINDVEQYVKLYRNVVSDKPMTMTLTYRDTNINHVDINEVNPDTAAADIVRATTLNDLADVITLNKAVLKIDMPGFIRKILQESEKLFEKVEIVAVFVPWDIKDPDLCAFLVEFLVGKHYKPYGNLLSNPLDTSLALEWTIKYVLWKKDII